MTDDEAKAELATKIKAARELCREVYANGYAKGAAELRAFDQRCFDGMRAIDVQTLALVLVLTDTCMELRARVSELEDRPVPTVEDVRQLVEDELANR